jgi:hypothetical protein
MSCIALSIVSLTVSSCGNIFTAQVAEDTLSLGVNSLMATPRQWVYPLDSSFTPMEEVTVTALYVDGTMRNVPVETVEIALNEVILADIYEAISLAEGKNLFKVSYRGKDAEFVLMVGSNAGNPDDPDNGEEKSGETTIEIPPPTWLQP